MELSKNNLYKKIAKSFDKAASSYDNFAIVQNEIARRLIERLSFLNISPKTILDLGSGTGYLSKELKKIYPESNITALDLSLNMLNFARKQSNDNFYINANAESLPFADKSFDLIISSCSMQWVYDLPSLFDDAKRVLTNSGHIIFATFGPDTLFELKESYKSLDNFEYINKFYDIQTIGNIMLSKSFAIPVVDKENICITYSSVITLLKDLRGIGSINTSDKKNKALFCKDKLKKLEKSYREKFIRDGILPATYEVIYGFAKSMPDDKRFNQASSVSIKILSE